MLSSPTQIKVWLLLQTPPDVCFNEHIEKYLKENVKFCVVEPQG